MPQDRSITFSGGLTESLGPFYDSVFGKAIGESKNGFKLNAPGGVFVSVVTTSQEYTFAVEVTRYKQEGQLDCCTVLVREPGLISGSYKYAFFIRRDRRFGDLEKYASKTRGLYGNDMTDQEKAEMEQEFLASGFDIDLTRQWYEETVERTKERGYQLEWPSEGIGVVV